MSRKTGDLNAPKKWVVKISEKEIFIITDEELETMKDGAKENDGYMPEVMRQATEKDLLMDAKGIFLTQ